MVTVNNPDELLDRLLDLARHHLRGGVEIDTEEMASLILQLHELMRSGEMPPKLWRPK